MIELFISTTIGWWEWRLGGHETLLHLRYIPFLEKNTVAFIRQKYLSFAIK
jgi:hypothetical protein